MMADIDPVIALLKEQIARDQTYLYAVAGAAIACGSFIGVKLLAALQQATAALTAQGETNRGLAEALDRLTKAVTDGNKD